MSAMPANLYRAWMRRLQVLLAAPRIAAPRANRGAERFTGTTKGTQRLREQSLS
jgi:hypothetical protein